MRRVLLVLLADAVIGVSARHRRHSPAQPSEWQPQPLSNYDSSDLPAVRRASAAVFNLTYDACSVARFDRHFVTGSCSENWDARKREEHEVMTTGGAPRLIKSVLLLLRGRSLVFLGDSLSQQHWLETMTQ